MGVLDKIDKYSDAFSTLYYIDSSVEIYNYMEPICKNYDSIRALYKDVFLSCRLIKNSKTTIAPLKDVPLDEYLNYELKNWIIRINSFPDILALFVNKVFQTKLAEREATLGKLLKENEVLQNAELKKVIRRILSVVRYDNHDALNNTINKVRNSFVHSGEFDIPALFDLWNSRAEYQLTENYVDFLRQVETEEDVLINLRKFVAKTSSDIFNQALAILHIGFIESRTRISIMEKNSPDYPYFNEDI